MTKDVATRHGATTDKAAENRDFCLRRHLGAGEGIRTLDPNLGKREFAL
jgi:hypothetical protein